MARRPGGEEKQRILVPYRIGFLDFAKEFISIRKLGMDFLSDLLANLVTAVVNSRADGSPDVLRLGAEPAMHFAHALLYNALYCSAPAGMKSTHRSLLLVHQNHR